MMGTMINLEMGTIVVGIRKSLVEMKVEIDLKII